MKTLLKLVGGLLVVGVLAVATVALLTPSMDRWGATDSEMAATFPGDELVPQPASFVNRAVTINAAPEQIYPWLVQLGAEKGGMYSYTVLENLVGCHLVNADRIHPEWQALRVGDPMKMCPGTFGPPPYIIAQLVPNQAIVMGHQENGHWVDLWQLVLQPQTDGSTRLVQRTRTMMVGGFLDILHPITFMMERGMLLGVKVRAEAMDPAALSALPATR
jgi:hypothetical protein